MASLSRNALKVLRERYLIKDSEGKVIETPEQMFRRVARVVVKPELNHTTRYEVKKIEDDFFDMMDQLYFIPNSPTLMNAGTKLGQLSACFVLPVGDALESIFSTLKDSALIHQSGGGTGFSFSGLRPSGARLKLTGGVSSGPVPFIDVFDKATEVIKSGGRRRGANMAILRVDHPDIEEFITSKQIDGRLNNFNISVALTDDFMEAVKKKELFDLRKPKTRRSVKKVSARKLFDLIAESAWKSADPGVVFIDRMNKDNPTPNIGKFESTNPCGETPLLNYESCNLGSLNLANFVKYEKVDYELLEKIVKLSVKFLDNIIEMNNYPSPEIEEATKKTRKIGLGVMGFADMLIKLHISYDSDKALEVAEEVMSFIKTKAKEASVELAKERGVFPAFLGSIYDTGKKEDRVRNATITTIAPTGSISIIAGCNPSIEPLFAVAYERNIIDRTLVSVNSLFKEMARRRGFYSSQVINEVAKKGVVHGIKEIPEDIQKMFITAHEVSPEYHVKVQASFQKHVDNAVSKTVNFVETATVEDVKNVYLLAYDSGCKGITVYRNNSKAFQVFNVGNTCLECDDEEDSKS